MVDGRWVRTSPSVTRSRLLSATASLFVLAALAGCGTSPGASATKKSIAGETCTKTDDCDGALRCLNAICQQPDADVSDTSASADAVQDVVDSDVADVAVVEVAVVDVQPEVGADAAPDALQDVDVDAVAQADVSADAAPDATVEVFVIDAVADTAPDAKQDVAVADAPSATDTGPDPCAGANCDDGNACTDDTCDKVQGCLHTANSLFCDDKNVCTTGDKCSAGVCVAGGFAGLSPTCNCQFDGQCDDSDTCTADTCVNYQCVHTQPTCSCVALKCGLPFGGGYVCACVNICVKSDGCCANSIQGCVP